MVIRRIRDHVADHNWFAVAVDVGIVVAGVFLGNQVSNWNQDRLDRARGDSYSATASPISKRYSPMPRRRSRRWGDLRLRSVRISLSMRTKPPRSSLAKPSMSLTMRFWRRVD